MIGRGRGTSRSNKSGTYVHSKSVAKRRKVSVATRAKNFRNLLLGAYDERCCITDCKVVGVLEGAHIDIHSGVKSDRVPNGLLLRRDIHRLFDLNMLGIDPKTMRVCASASLMKLKYDPYSKLVGNVCRSPADAWNCADVLALSRRWEKFQASKYLD
jgi:predicted restriction endonuclease